MKEKIIVLNQDQEFITLQSLLKLTNVVDSGGMAKLFLQDNDVKVNSISETRRGRKLYQGDKIEVLNTTYIVKKP